MRICLLTTSTTVHQMGGTEVQAETLAKEAAKLGHSVFILTSAHPAGPQRENNGTYTAVYIPDTHFSMSRPWVKRWEQELPKAAAALREKEKIDVFWAENFSGLPYAAIPSEKRAPLISIANGLAFRGEIASAFNGVSGIGGLFHFFTRYAGQALFYHLPRFRALARDSDLIAAVSRETEAALNTEFPASKGKTFVVYNPVDCALFKADASLRAQARAELGFAASDLVILMAGVLHRQKGIHLGLKAFSAIAEKFPSTRLLIAGDGPQRAELEKAAATLRRRVIFCGTKGNAEMPACYNAADIYLNPTLRGEGLGLVNIEAMACGLPCVISKAGGTGSTIDEGLSGYFTAPGNVPETEARLSALLSDGKLRLEMGTAGRKKALKVFEISTVVKRYVSASLELLAKRAQRLP